MRFNPEAQFSRRENGELSEPQAALYNIIVPKNKEQAIDIKEFSDLYGETSVRKDLQYVENLEAKFAQEDGKEGSRKIGELFEAIINSQIEESDWMGANANVIVPSRYDDIVNGIDSVVEFEDDNAVSHLALAIDITESEQGIVSKFQRIKSSIEQDELSRAKYFRSKNFRGELSRVPRVVIGAEGSTIEGVTDILLRFKRMQRTIAENRKNNDRSDAAQALTKEFSKLRNLLAEHPLQNIILHEIKIQLEAFHDYAQARGKTYAAKDYSNMLNVIQEIINEKNAPTKEEKDTSIPEDRIFNMILEKAQSLGDN